MNKLLKRITAIMLTIALVCMVGCKKADEPNNGGNNGNNGGNGGETPEAPAIVSTSEVQYDGKVFVEAVFEDETKMYFEILSPNEVSVVNGEYYYQDNPSLAYIYRGEVVIPETISHLGMAYSVIAIGQKAFYGCNLVTSVFIPNSIRYIIDTNTVIYGSGGISMTYANTCGAGAFQGCNNLISIRMSENIRWIGDNAFAGCPCYLETVTIPSSVTHVGIAAFDSENIVFNAENCSCAGGEVYPNGLSEEAIYYSAFPYMTSINFGNGVKMLPSFLYSNMNPTIVDIPSSVTILPIKAFRGCINLERINGMENVLEIGASAFEKCESLNSISLNSDLARIENNTFYGCKSLNSIEIPNSVTTIDYSAFENCSSLTEVAIPNSVTTIGRDAFRSCENLATLTIGNSVTTIGCGAFAECKELSNVDFGNSISEIEGLAFDRCDKLLDIILPSSVSHIGRSAFWTGLNVNDTTIVSCMALTPPIIDSEVFSGRWNLLIYVPMSSVEAYKTADGWREYANVIVGIP